MSDTFDIVIVGAGPAGSTAACTAAAEGCSVLLLEEHPKIGIPVVCAEGISRRTLTPYLDIKPEWVSQSVLGLIVRGPEGEEFKVEYQDPSNCGCVLNRKIFDPALAKMAEEKGAVIKTSAKAIGIEGNEVIVNEFGEKRRYRFKFLIGADGMASHVGKWMGIDTRLSLGEIEVCAAYIIEGIEINPQYGTFIFCDDYAPGGYAWIFPKSNNSANVGLGISPLKTKKGAKYFLDKWVRKEFPEGTIKKKIFGGVPAKALKQFSAKNFYLIGDAARFTNPISGGGIGNSVKSGVIAGRNAVLRLKGKKDYFVEEVNQEILGEIEFQCKIRNVYLKFTDKEYKDFYKIGKKLYAGKKIEDISIPHLVKVLLLSSPRLFRIGFHLLF